PWRHYGHREQTAPRWRAAGLPRGQEAAAVRRRRMPRPASRREREGRVAAGGDIMSSSTPILAAASSAPAKSAAEAKERKRGMQYLPLAERDAITLREAESLGYGSERGLRQMIATGRLRDCVLRIGRRGVRLLRSKLVEELNRPRKQD